MPDEPTPDVQETPGKDEGPAPQDGGGESNQIAKLRAENAKWRVKLRDLEQQAEEWRPKAEQYDALQESQRTEAEKLATQLEEAQRQLDAERAERETAQKRARLTALAVNAGVDPEVVQMLDLGQFDLDDTDGTNAALGKLAKSATVGGTSSNPSRPSGQTKEQELEEWWKRRKSGGPTIFGG